MKTWKKLLLFFSAIAILAIACILSFSYGFKNGMDADGFTSSLAEFSLLNQHMSDQMANANCEGAKQALNDYLTLLDKYKDVKASFLSGTTYYGDKMLSHVRLARIEKYIGDDDKAQKHMALAKEACANRKWEDCSEEKLLSISKQLEKKNPIVCLEKEK